MAENCELFTYGVNSWGASFTYSYYVVWSIFRHFYVDSLLPV